MQGQILHSITNDSIVLVRTTRRRDVFLPPFSLHSAGSFLPCHRPSAGRGKGLASSPAACGRPSRYRQPAKVIRIFHEKWKKEGWFVPVERQETLLHTGEKRYNHLAVRPGGRCVRCSVHLDRFPGVCRSRKLPLFLFFGFIVTIFVENSKRENKNFCDFPGRPGCLPPLPRCPRAAFFTGFLPGFLGVSGGFPAGTELTGKNRRATLRLVS